MEKEYSDRCYKCNQPRSTHDDGECAGVTRSMSQPSLGRCFHCDNIITERSVLPSLCKPCAISFLASNGATAKGMS
jgi:hypothetical protein